MNLSRNPLRPGPLDFLGGRHGAPEVPLVHTQASGTCSAFFLRKCPLCKGELASRAIRESKVSKRQGWRDFSAVKSTYFSSRGPRVRFLANHTGQFTSGVNWLQRRPTPVTSLGTRTCVHSSPNPCTQPSILFKFFKKLKAKEDFLGTRARQKTDSS